MSKGNNSNNKKQEVSGCLAYLVLGIFAFLAIAIGVFFYLIYYLDNHPGFHI